MDYLFSDLRAFVGVYVDDILIFSSSIEEHVQACRKVFQKLRQEHFYAGQDKCTFAQPEVEYCGFIVGKQGVRPQPQKLVAIREWPPPTNVTEVRSFLGLCGFYQRFVADYAHVSAPLTDLQHKGITWHWEPKQHKAFVTLKSRPLNAPVLAHPDMSKPFILHTDASDFAIGATLSQMGPDGQLHLVACRSKKLDPDQRNYAVHEKKCSHW